MFGHNSKLACYVHECHHHMDFENVEVVGHEAHYHQWLFQGMITWSSQQSTSAWHALKIFSSHVHTARVTFQF